ncbi:MAG TPA: Holliday junction branch migration protein RuvA [Pirellulales bacterium]|nr:Holliday junction branch migration protein RuvA [Pirellulales bacterium]
MITNISGRLLRLDVESLTLQVGAFQYEVLIPEFARRRLQSQIDHDISLHTIEYLEGSAMNGRMTPRLIGFLTEVEREFFDLVCEVDGVGVKKALRAMVRPVREVAAAIEEQDVKSLAGLPGIGPATAERMVAKLRRKMPKFALMVARDEPRTAETEADRDILRETFDALRSLGHSEHDARRLIEAALETKKKPKTVEEMLQAIYQQSHKK